MSVWMVYADEKPEAEVISLGTIGTRQCDIDKLIRKLQFKDPVLVFVYKADLCGYWLYRYLTRKGAPCRVVAPSRIPQEGRGSGKDRPARRCATHAFGGPHLGLRPRVEDEATRDLSRTRR